MTGYFFHCQHKYRTHEKKELSTNRRGMKAHIVHTMLTLLLMSSSSAFCVFGLACISTTATTIHFFRVTVYFFLFFVNSCICETAGWCCLFFYAHYSFFLYFFRACCLHTFLRTIARDLFVPFIFSRILPPKYEDCFSV